MNLKTPLNSTEEKSLPEINETQTSNIINRLSCVKRYNPKLYKHHYEDYFVDEKDPNGKYVRYVDILQIIESKLKKISQ